MYLAVRPRKFHRSSERIEAEQDAILAFRQLPDGIEDTIASMGGMVRAVLGEIDAILVTGTSDFLVAMEGVKGFEVAIPDGNGRLDAGCPADHV